MLSKFFITDPEKDKLGKKTSNDSRLKRLIPNIITLSSMVCGLTAIQMGISELWQNAVLFILFATVMDTLDGAMARLLNVTSKFGAELDSLADFLSFGIAPAVIMYLWVLHEAGRIGWIAALVFVIAAALRLARFNATAEDQDKKPEWGKYFFTGIPAPAGAGLMLMPLIIYLQIDTDLSAFGFATPVIGLWALVISALMVSSIPTFSSKQIRLPAIGTIPTLAILGLFLAMIIHAPWITLTVAGLIYALSIPFSYNIYHARDQRSQKSKAKPDA